jgi:hypothetical protein
MHKKAHAGTGIMYGIVVTSMLLLSSYLVMSKTSQTYDTALVTTSVNMDKAEGVAQWAMQQAENFFKSQIDASVALSVGSTTSGNLTVPTDPNNLAGATQTVGTYNAVISVKRGKYYYLTVNGVFNGNQFTSKKIFYY